MNFEYPGGRMQEGEKMHKSILIVDESAKELYDF